MISVSNLTKISEMNEKIPMINQIRPNKYQLYPHEKLICELWFSDVKPISILFFPEPERI